MLPRQEIGANALVDTGAVELCIPRHSADVSASMAKAGWMMRTSTGAACIAITLMAPAARAADRFAGWHIGPAVGAVQTHFVVEDADSGRRLAEPQAWGPGASLFAGRDWAIAGPVLFGLGVELNLLGRTATAMLPGIGSASITPRHGWAITARAGIAPTPGTLLYVRGGYHEHRYRLASAGDLAFDFGAASRSFSIGAGAELALTARLAARIELHHLDGTRNQVMLGLPLRF